MGLIAIAGRGSKLYLSSGGGGGSGAANQADAYTDYDTYWVDGLNGSDANSGNSELNAKQTISAGHGLLTQGGRRVMVKPTVTYTPSATINAVSATGTSDTARCVMKGLPGAPAPIIDFSGAARGFVLAGSGVNCSYLTYHHLEARNSGGGQSIWTIGTDGTATGLMWKYVYGHKARRNNVDNLAIIYNQGNTAATGLIEDCHLGDVSLDNGSFNDNTSALHSYQWKQLIVRRTRFFGAGNGIRVKAANASAPNGWTIEKCIFDDLALIGVAFSIQGAGGPRHEGATISDCLFTRVVGSCVEATLFETGTQSTLIDIYGNTFGSDCLEAAVRIRGFTGISGHSNAFLQVGQCLETVDPTPWANGVLEWDYSGAYQKKWHLNQYGSPERTYTTASGWRSAKTTHNPADLSTLVATNPDANFVDITSIATHYANHAARDYTRVGGSALIAAGKAGRNIGADDYGPTWSP